MSIQYSSSGGQRFDVCAAPVLCTFQSAKGLRQELVVGRGNRAWKTGNTANTLASCTMSFTGKQWRRLVDIESIYLEPVAADGQRTRQSLPSNIIILIELSLHPSINPSTLKRISCPILSRPSRQVLQTSSARRHHGRQPRQHQKAYCRGGRAHEQGSRGS